MVFGHADEGSAGQSTKDNKPVSATGPMLQGSKYWMPTQYAYPKETKAVIIRCDSEAYPSEGRRVYQTTTISSFETQFHLNDEPLDIPTLVGLPLWMRQHPWTGARGDELKPGRESEIENPLARPLCRNGRPESSRFGAPPSLKGDKLVARLDGKDLLVQHLVCLGAFCNLVVARFSKTEVGRGTGEGGVRRSERGATGEAEECARERGVRFRGMANRESFRSYWVWWRRQKFDESGLEEWLRMRGPYEM
ncbi:hypothetical protein HO173_000672 [Letharia columbiana]|uniref:Uncharacterized protein n=1 Tax=Letharia columbiana TaxID=112416 RepID=A0A8H6G599_9LECA|nr:uncharacterized protein HO173_000672 [Letharia columbiana]KAF6240880.1 hypothetical protein HO173_000672 [Letharia columbiana]